MLSKVSEFLPHSGLAKVSIFSNPNVKNANKKIKYCNDLNRKNFLSRSWAAREEWKMVRKAVCGQDGSTDLQKGNAVGPEENQERLELYLNGLLSQ